MLFAPKFWEDGVICHSENVDGLVVIFGGGGDTSTLHAVIELVLNFLHSVVVETQTHSL